MRKAPEELIRALGSELDKLLSAHGDLVTTRDSAAGQALNTACDLLAELERSVHARGEREPVPEPRLGLLPLGDAAPSVASGRQGSEVCHASMPLAPLAPLAPPLAPAAPLSPLAPHASHPLPPHALLSAPARRPALPPHPLPYPRAPAKPVLQMVVAVPGTSCTTLKVKATPTKRGFSLLVQNSPTAITPLRNLSSNSITGLQCGVNVRLAASVQYT